MRRTSLLPFREPIFVFESVWAKQGLETAMKPQGRKGLCDSFRLCGGFGSANAGFLEHN